MNLLIYAPTNLRRLFRSSRHLSHGGICWVTLWVEERLLMLMQPPFL